MHAYLGMYNFHGEMGHGPLILRRVIPVLACLEGEYGDVMARWYDGGVQ